MLTTPPSLEVLATLDDGSVLVPLNQLVQLAHSNNTDGTRWDENLSNLLRGNSQGQVVKVIPLSNGTAEGATAAYASATGYSMRKVAAADCQMHLFMMPGTKLHRVLFPEPAAETEAEPEKSTGVWGWLKSQMGL
jgi:hypothetical protein